MPKPTTKHQLIETAQAERAALEQLLAELTPEQMTQPNLVGDWSAKDVLAHLIEWEQMVIHWYEMGAKGETPSVPSADYNWGKLPQLNHSIYLKHRDKPLPQIMDSFKASYTEIMNTVEAIPESELFTRKIYKWANNNPLAAYFISATSSHYRWARTELRKGFKRSK